MGDFYCSVSFKWYSFAGQSILKLKLFSVSAQNTSLHALLVFKVSVEKSAVIVVALPLYIIWFFSITAFSILSLFFVVIVLAIVCLGEVLF
jgi:uncharacterized Tic20 family protein